MTGIAWFALFPGRRERRIFWVVTTLGLGPLRVQEPLAGSTCNLRGGLLIDEDSEVPAHAISAYLGFPATVSMAGHTPKTGCATQRVEGPLRGGGAVARGLPRLVVVGQPAMLGVGDDRAPIREDNLEAGASRRLVEDARDPARVARRRRRPGRRPAAGPSWSNRSASGSGSRHQAPCPIPTGPAMSSVWLGCCSS